MRKTAALLIGAAVIASGLGCSKRGVVSSPWTRWGITKPTNGRNAESRLVAAHRLLYETKFDSAQVAYRDLVLNFPQSAEAHLGLSMASRYLAQRDSAFNEARASFALDSEAVGVLLNYGNLMLPLRTGPLPDLTDSARNTEAERVLLKAAASRHPFAAHAHIELWAAYMAQGRLADAKHEAFELSDKHYYPQPLLDFAYNLLVGLAPNAVLITNGDNDTYPLWALQNASSPFRPDVTVANVSLLNVKSVVKMMRDSLNLPLSLTDSELDSLKPRPSPGGIEPPAQQVVANIIANASRFHRPVYFALTLRPEVGGPFGTRLKLEGLVNRVLDSATVALTDYDRIAENLAKVYRLEWPDSLPPWPDNMSPLSRRIAPLALNYANLYGRVAPHYDSLGNRAAASEARKQAVTWLLRADNKVAAAGFLEAWLNDQPDDPEAKKLKARVDRM